jgi:hypothetical protein
VIDLHHFSARFELCLYVATARFKAHQMLWLPQKTRARQWMRNTVEVWEILNHAEPRYDLVLTGEAVAMEDDLGQLEARLITLVVASPDKLGRQMICCVEVAHLLSPNA